MDPPGTVLITTLGSQPLGIKTQVGQVWTVFILIFSRLAGIEAGPGIEDERTLRRAAAVKTGQINPASALHQTEHEVFRGYKVAGGRIHDLIK